MVKFMSVSELNMIYSESLMMKGKIIFILLRSLVLLTIHQLKENGKLLRMMKTER